MYQHRHSRMIRGLLVWLIASVLMLPFSAMSGIYCGEKHDGAASAHCQHDPAQQLVADKKVADDDDCCCNGIFHVLGCQHHCQTAGHASLITVSPCPLMVGGQAWETPAVASLEDAVLSPPFHPPRT